MYVLPYIKIEYQWRKVYVAGEKCMYVDQSVHWWRKVYAGGENYTLAEKHLNFQLQNLYVSTYEKLYHQWMKLYVGGKKCTFSAAKCVCLTSYKGSALV